MPLVVIPEAYRGPTQGVSEVEVEGETVRECLEAVEKLHPGFAPLVFDGAGELHRFVKLFINDVGGYYDNVIIVYGWPWPDDFMADVFYLQCRLGMDFHAYKIFEDGNCTPYAE